jgi:hypothetical protein
MLDLLFAVNRSRMGLGNLCDDLVAEPFIPQMGLSMLTLALALHRPITHSQILQFPYRQCIEVAATAEVFEIAAGPTARLQRLPADVKNVSSSVL